LPNVYGPNRGVFILSWREHFIFRFPFKAFLSWRHKRFYVDSPFRSLSSGGESHGVAPGRALAPLRHFLNCYKRGRTEPAVCKIETTRERNGRKQKNATGANEVVTDSAIERLQLTFTLHNKTEKMAGKSFFYCTLLQSVKRTNLPAFFYAVQGAFKDEGKIVWRP